MTRFHATFIALAIATAGALALSPTAAADNGVPVAPGCYQVFVGPDIDSGFCQDLNGEDCRVWRYDTYGTMGGYQCYV